MGVHENLMHFNPELYSELAQGSVYYYFFNDKALVYQKFYMNFSSLMTILDRLIGFENKNGCVKLICCYFTIFELISLK